MKKAVFYFIFSLLGSCAFGRESHVWVSYNVQNLFDGQKQGAEYKEFTPESGWTPVLYQQKLVNLSEVFEAVKRRSGPIGLVLLQEVENERVLLDLAALSPPLRGMQALFIKKPGQAAGLGLLTRYKARDIQGIDPFLFDEAGRLILNAVLEVNGSEIAVFNCHLPSKQSDKQGVLRAQAVAALASAARERQASGLPVVIGGDFNMAIDEESLSLGQTSAAALALSGDSRHMPKGFFYTPWPAFLTSPLAAGVKGSFFFRDRWEAIDHFFVDAGFFNGESCFKYVSFYPFAEERFRFQSETGAPLGPYRFDARSAKGYSDHLPLVLALESRRKQDGF